MAVALAHSGDAQAKAMAYARYLFRYEYSERWREVAAMLMGTEGHADSEIVRASFPTEALDARHPAPAEAIPAYTILASDGSQIEPDRHGPASYFLLNVSRVRITYGPQAGAEMTSTPHLAYGEALFITHDHDPSPRQTLVDGSILAMKRAIAEVAALADLAETELERPTIALIDGPLPLFARVEREQGWVTDLLRQEYQVHLERLRARGIPVCGIISRSEGDWLMTMLRAVTCRQDTTACTYCSRPDVAASLCILTRLRDHHLFDDRDGLRPGQRSALFKMANRLYDGYGDNTPYMFYMNSGQEIMQVQVPQWVTREAPLLTLIHALIWQQCQNGDGYPTALARAHEQAVISPTEHRQVESIIARMLLQQGIPVHLSEKARAKQRGSTI